MRAAYYEQLGAARDVLRLGDVETPQVGPGEVRVRVHTSGINPSDVKRRGGSSISLFGIALREGERYAILPPLLAQLNSMQRSPCDQR